MPALRLESEEYVEVAPDTSIDELLAFVEAHHRVDGRAGQPAQGLRVQFDEPLPAHLLRAIGDAVEAFPEVEVYACGRADADLAWTALMPRVRHLSLSTARTESFAPLADLVDLRALSLPETLSRRPSLAPLAALAALEELGIAGHERGFEVVADLPALRHLGLYASRVADFEALAGHPALEAFSFGFGRVRDLAPLARVPHLRALRFWRVSRFEDEHAEALGDLAGLESLALADQPRITDLAPLTRAPAPTLRSLELDGLHGLRSAAFLAGLPALEELLVLDSGAVPDTLTTSTLRP
ncbi:leucine-rich repeat domain-containing protein [Amnibacterium setariae]|uniref:Leucine-rich repeat domain-containing protein n=1 Tax=Amnibacterium setariae TaxID=2306585 RepID=A0A3A1U3S0_9MICO|nr:hypothetical protein [Amnibacterium setariae]RIX31003.1 hypothetical protein D1781_06410 [Amnibacterium setariae]